MTKLGTTLEKLTYFSNKWREFNHKQTELNKEAETLDKEFNEWMQKEMKFEGHSHISQIMKQTLEMTYEPNHQG